jgi:hypothetical protein
VDPRGRTVGVRNPHHTRDIGYLRWVWLLEAINRPNVPLGRL